MRRMGPDEWSGLAMLVVCAGVGVPVIIGMAPVRVVPVWLWTFVFLIVLALVVVVAVLGEHRRAWARTAYFAALLLAYGLVIAAPGGGLIAILLIAIAALGVYVLPLAAVLGVVAVNTVVIAANSVDVLLVGGIYLFIHLATVFSSAAMLREQRMRRELAEAHVELRAASVLLSESARTAERLRISRELHDLIGHQLTVLALELEAAKHREGDAARAHVERADGVARGLLADVRATVGELRAEGPGDLADALDRVGRELPGLDVVVDVADDVRVDEARTEAMVRAAQEVVTNTLRHADARELRISVTREADGIRLLAVDDGRGDRRAVPGNGLRGLQERFAALGGLVEFDGTRGFRVEARMPAP